MKYAIKVPFEDDGLYVTETGTDGNPTVLTYDTHEEAEQVNSTVWKGKGTVVEYDASPMLSVDDIPVSDLTSLPPEQGITPDAWVIIEVNHEGEQFQKIIAGWSGSYLYGDSWRMSSRIKEIKIDVEQDYITVETDSGSVYNLPKQYQGLKMSNAGVYNELKEKFGDAVEIVEL